jgi:hypothetical protein
LLRWLSSLPAYALFPLLGAVGIGLTFLLDDLRRRFVPQETRERASGTASVTLQVTATIYAILIAFVIVDAYTQLRDTQGEITAKASALTTIYENSAALPDPGGNDVQAETLAYAGAFVRRGIPRLEEDAEPDPATTRELHDLFRAVESVEPTTPSETAAYESIASALTAVEGSREQLLSSARATVPPALVWLLVFIGLVVMSIATMLDTRHRRSHLAILSALALVIWLTIALVLSMDYPFSGVIRVTADPMREFLELPLVR